MTLGLGLGNASRIMQWKNLSSCHTSHARVGDTQLLSTLQMGSQRVRCMHELLTHELKIGFIIVMIIILRKLGKFIVASQRENHLQK